MKSLTLFSGSLLLGLMLAIPAMAQTDDMRFDAIRNIGIEGDKIAAISEFEMSGANTIDVKGHMVAPGFIDTRAHGQDLPDHWVQAMQGVTTVFELESGILPIAAWYQSQVKKPLPLNDAASAGWTFSRIEHDDVIQKISAKGTDHAFDEWFLPR